MSKGERLAATASSRERYDALLSEFASSCTASELRDIAAHLPGLYVRGTKAAIVNQMHNWQREDELNTAAHAAQAKAAL